VAWTFRCPRLFTRLPGRGRADPTLAGRQDLLQVPQEVGAAGLLRLLQQGPGRLGHGLQQRGAQCVAATGGAAELLQRVAGGVHLLGLRGQLRPRGTQP